MKSILLLCQLLLVITIAAGCASTNDGSTGSGADSAGVKSNMGTTSAIVMDTPGGKVWPRDGITVGLAEITGKDTLHLRVSHGGGCREHEYALVASGAFMESYPVQAGVFLAHNANGDRCKAMITTDLYYDLTPLLAAYKAGYKEETGVLMLRLDGWRELIRYEF